MEKIDLGAYVDESVCVTRLSAQSLPEISEDASGVEIEAILAEMESPPNEEYCFACPVCGSTSLRIIDRESSDIAGKSVYINMECACGRNVDVNITELNGAIRFAVVIDEQDYGAYLDRKL